MNENMAPVFGRRIGLQISSFDIPLAFWLVPKSLNDLVLSLDMFEQIILDSKTLKIFLDLL